MTKKHRMHSLQEIIRRAALLGGAALAAWGCLTREIEIPGQAGNDVAAGHDEASVGTTRTVTFIATQADTRAQFGPQEGGAWPTLWTDNDSEVKLSLNFGGAQTAGVTPSQDYRTATFSAEIDFSGVSGPYRYYAVSPASAAQAMSPSREAWRVSIPCEQTPTAGSVDEAAIIIASASAEFNTSSSPSSVDLQFSHLTAYGCMSLANLALRSGETVTAVEMTATVPIVGDWYWQTSGAQITDYGASYTLTINTSSTSGIWFACAPVSVGGEMMTVTVYTTEGTYEQLVEFPAGASFEAGRAAVFTVDMDGVDLSEGVPAADPILGRTEYGCYLGTGFEWEYNPATDQMSRSYDSSGLTGTALTFTLIRPGTVEELEIGGFNSLKTKGSDVTVSVHWRQGFGRVLNDTYQMKVVKEEGPKVWIGDGTGRGIIIKK